MPSNLALLIFLVLIIVIVLICEEHKSLLKAWSDSEKYAKDLVEKMNMEIKLKEIIIESKKNKENYFVTLEKIEKELFD